MERSGHRQIYGNHDCSGRSVEDRDLVVHLGEGGRNPMMRTGISTSYALPIYNLRSARREMTSHHIWSSDFGSMIRTIALLALRPFTPLGPY